MSEGHIPSLIISPLPINTTLQNQSPLTTPSATHPTSATIKEPIGSKVLLLDRAGGDSSNGGGYSKTDLDCLDVCCENNWSTINDLLKILEIGNLLYTIISTMIKILEY